MSLKEIETKDIEESKQNNDIKNENNNKNLLIKFVAIKNALIEERKKSSSLEKENILLKEENIKNNEKIMELKDEIKKYHDSIDKKGNSNFFSELFNNMNISEIKNTAIIEKLNSENLKIKEELSSTKKELNLIKMEYREIILKTNSQKNQYEKKIKYLLQEKENINIKYKEEKEKLSNKLNEIDLKNRNLEEKIRIFNSDREYFEQSINKLKNEIKIYKEEINKKNSEIDNLFKEQEKIINNNTEFKQKVINLKNIINQYKKAIDNTTRITDNYVFIGKIIPNTHYNNTINLNNDNGNDDIFINVENKLNDINKKEIFKKIKIMFDFYRRKVNIQIDNQKQISIEIKNIIDIVENLHIEGQIKIFFKIKDTVYDYLCQFTKKESDFIIYFHKELKNESQVNPALLGLYLATSL